MVLAPSLDPLAMPPCTMRAGHGGVPFFECMTQIAFGGSPDTGVSNVFILDFFDSDDMRGAVSTGV